MMNSNEDNSWRTETFRQGIIAKIEEAIQKSAMPTNKSSSEMENHVFKKANSKDEYLSYVARLILHVREMINPNQKKMNPQQASPDPMNALRAMTGQPGGGNQMMNNMQQQGGPVQMNPASNLLQSLNHQRPNLQMAGMQQGVMGPMAGSMVSMQQGPMQQGPRQPINMQPMQQNPIHGGPMVGQVSQMTMGGQMGQLPGQMGSVINNQISGQVPTQMNAGMPHSPMNITINQMAAQRKMVSDGMMIPSANNIPYMPPRHALPNHFIRQNTPPPNQQSMQINTVNMIPSPAMVPSPQSAAGGGMVGIRPTGPSMAPSPNSNVSLNTPGGQSQPTPSPLSNNDEQAYQEKVRQLSKYIEPLRRMIQRSGSGDHEKMSKMKKLLEILSSTGQRITMEALLKCETVLEKLDIKTGHKEQQHPLIEAINTALQSSNANHTFQRTFEPVMSTLNGKPLKNLPRPLKRKQAEETVGDIPEVLQGEVARLDQRFKVSLDPVQQNSSKCVHLLCWLDDRHLPCIPPVQITIPEDYPNSSPKCDMSNYEYGATKFLQLIQEALRSRISKLPPRYTMSQLLDMWENSVRETCSSNRFSNTEVPVVKI